MKLNKAQNIRINKLTIINSTKTNEKENIQNTPFQNLRSNLDNKKKVLIKKKERDAKLNFQILYEKHNGNLKFYELSDSINYETKLVKYSNSDKTIPHLYKNNENLFKETSNKLLVMMAEENVGKFCLQNKLKGEFLPNINPNCSLNYTYIYSSIQNYNKRSKYQNTENSYMRLFQIK